MKRALIFAHFDPDGLIDDHVLYSLTCYRQYFQIIHFVSTADLSVYQQSRLSSLVDRVIVRENIGYDFLSWRVGLEMLPAGVAFDEFIFANDSCYGPCHDMALFWGKVEALNADIWGASLNRQFAPHVQSYFMGFRGAAIRSGFMRRFWDDVAVISDKMDMILAYEVGLSVKAMAEGLSVKGVVDYPTIDADLLSRVLADNASQTDMERSAKAIAYLTDEHFPNPAQLYWAETLRRGSPFIKVELLRDNPLSANLAGLYHYLKRERWYDVSLIANHLMRTVGCIGFPPAPAQTNAGLRPLEVSS
jgi:lipopolysaccharide biosynthesis protein